MSDNYQFVYFTIRFQFRQSFSLKITLKMLKSVLRHSIWESNPFLI